MKNIIIAKSTVFHVRFVQLLMHQICEYIFPSSILLEFFAHHINILMELKHDHMHRTSMESISKAVCRQMQPSGAPVI